MKLLDYPTFINTLRMVPILKIYSENSTTKTFVIEDKLLAKSKPGQFLMLWVPNSGEIPISIMNVDLERIIFTVKNVGETTNYLHNMNEGEKIGVRGPYGSSFSLRKGKVLIVGGGTGVAPLLFLTSKLINLGSDVSFAIGAKTSDDLLFIKKIKDICNNNQVIVTTEDGSFGLKCLVTDPIKKLLNEKTFDIIYSCGPELMVKKIYDLANSLKIDFEASLERLMRCSIGLCGSCMIGLYRVCKDGPVFTKSQLKNVINEFGISKLSQQGKSIKL